MTVVDWTLLYRITIPLCLISASRYTIAFPAEDCMALRILLDRYLTNKQSRSGACEKLVLAA